MWIAVLVSVLLVAAPVHVDRVVDVQVQVDADEVAVIEIALPASCSPAPTVVLDAGRKTPSPAPDCGRVFRPPRPAFA